MVKSYKCGVCGYIHVGNQPPEVCNVCGASGSEFEVFEQEYEETINRPSYWRCINCEYIHQGDMAPEVCPICGANTEAFENYKKIDNTKSEIGNIKIVILGGGIAGISAAEEIRKNSNKPEITIISKEEQLPYYRLNLTRYIAKETDKDKLNIHSYEWYEENRINVLCGKECTYINKEKRTIELNDGTLVNYDKLIIAMGAHPFIPPIKGVELKNVITVRSIEDADKILKGIKVFNSCICIGAGILGIETAGAIAKNGVKVTLLEGANWLMPRQLNYKGSVLFKRYLMNLNIDIKENSRVESIFGNKYCEGVILEDGEVLEADFIIITAGVRPNTYLARKCEIEVNKGLVVNNNMKTSEEDIYAAGDVTEHYGILYGLWKIARFQGIVAGRNAIGINAQFGGIPRSNVLKVLGLDMFSIGELELLDGSYYKYEYERENNYFYFVIRDGRVVGSIIIGNKELSIKVKKAVEKRTRFPKHIFDDIESFIWRLME